MLRRAKLFYYYLITPVLASMVILLVPKLQAQEILSEGDIVITEIMINPEGVTDTDGEWFELFNISDRTLNLSECIFSDNGSDDFTITESLVLEPQTYIILARNNNTELNGGVIADYMYSGFTLANSEDEIVLTCGELEIDRVEYSGGLNFPTPAGSAIMLANLSTDNNTGVNWCTTNTTFGLGDHGTPGGPNGACATKDDTNEMPTLPENKQPVAEAGENQTVAVNEIAHFDASASTDPDSDTLTFIWNFGDGTQATGVTTEHTYLQANTYAVTLTVDDGKTSVQDSLVITVTQQNKPLTNTIIINELLPNPTGSDETGEWIELKNTGDSTVNITGYALADLSEKTYVLQSENLGNLDIAPNGFFLLFRSTSKISLNNTQTETVRLYDSQGIHIDEITYIETAKENMSYAKFPTVWSWTNNPTPHADNILSDPTEQKTSSEEEIITVENYNGNVILPSTKTDCPATEDELLLINELWPSPQGDDQELEFIELYNPNEHEVNICAYQLSDKTTTYIFSTSTTITPLEYLLIYRTDSHLSLNNMGDTITLSNLQGTPIHSVTYPRAPTDMSWSRNEMNEFEWTDNITPGEDNITPLTTIKNTTYNETILTGAAATSPADSTPLEEVIFHEANDTLTLEGTITCPPGILGSQIMYLSDGAGIQIYQHYKDWPELETGDAIKVYGTLSYVNGLPRLKVKKQEDISIINTKNIPPTTSLISFIDIDDTLVQRLIIATGTVIDKQKDTILLGDDSGELNVYIKPSTDIQLPEITEGDILEVTGILTKEKSGYHLLPRATTDIRITKTVNSSFTEINAPKIVIPDKKMEFGSYSTIIYLYITLGGIIIILLSKIYKLKNAHGNYQEHKRRHQAD